MLATYDVAADWAADWHGAVRVDASGREATNLRLREAALFLSGSMFAERFRLFSRGGLPRLERHRGEWTQEILLRAGAYCPKRNAVPIRLVLHLCHSNVQEIRAKYYRPSGIIPKSIAVADIGELEKSDRKFIWWVDGSPSVMEDMASWATFLAATWFDAVGDPDVFTERLYARRLGLFHHANSLEALLAEGERGSARRYINRCLVESFDFWDAVKDVRSRPVMDFPNDLDLRKAATIAQSYDLL